MQHNHLAAIPRHRITLFGRTFHFSDRQVQFFFICAGLLVGYLMTLSPIAAWAQTTAPWEGPMCSIAKSLSGPVARYGAILAFAVAGLLMMFGELGGIFKYAVNIVMGASIAIGAANWVTYMTGNSVSLGC